MSNLQRIRKERNYTQGQLSYIAKVPVKTIQAYEQWARDINKATGDTLKKIADALDCTIDDLLEE